MINKKEFEFPFIMKKNYNNAYHEFQEQNFIKKEL